MDDREAERWRTFRAQQPGASWRRQPPTRKQLAALRVFGVCDLPRTRGQASEMIGRYCPDVDERRRTR